MGLQENLVKGRPGDFLEREANTMADAVTRRSGCASGDVSTTLYNRITSIVQCQTEDEDAFQAKVEKEKLVQPQAEEEEEEPVQAQVEEEEESVQAQVEEEEEEPVHAQVEEEEEEPVQAQVEEEEEEPVQAQIEEEEPIQTETEVSCQPVTPDSVRNKLRSCGAQGSPLADDVRNRMEPQFGADFSGVRIHTDALAVKLTRLLKAKAFTRGRNIYFNQGRFAPGTHAGDHLLAHELTHTVQQGAVASREVQLQSDSSMVQCQEEDDRMMIRPELLAAVRAARGEIGKVNARKTGSDNTRIGWERLNQYFMTAFGGKEVIHENVIRYINKVKNKEGILQDPMPSWCGIFVWWALKKSGIPIPDWKLGANILKWVETRAPGELPQKGDIAYREAFDHFAIVSGVEGFESREGKNYKSIRVATINGNTSGNDNLGGQIEEKWEPISRWLAFFNPIAKLELPPVELVVTGVEPDFEEVGGKEFEAVVPDEIVEEKAPTNVDALYGDLPAVEGAEEVATADTDIGVELPEPPAPTPEEIAAVEPVSLEGTSEGAMTGFTEATPSQMAVTQPALGQTLDGKINEESQNEANEAPALTVSTSGKLEGGLTPPDQIPVPGDVRMSDGLTEADPGDLETKAHKNRGEKPSNQENERLLDEKEKSEGFLDWLRVNAKPFMAGIRTRDSGLNTKAGERPNVELEGESNPGRMAEQRGDANNQLKAQRDAATDKFKNHPGQQNIQPREVNEEKTAKLSPIAAVKIEVPKDQTIAEYAEAPLPADVRGKADELFQPGLQSNLTAARGQIEQAAGKRESDKTSEMAKAESDTAKANEEADQQQRDVVLKNRQDVAQHQKDGIAEAYGKVDEFNNEADTQQKNARKEIGDKVKDTEGKARTELNKGEAEADKKKIEGEKEAAAKKRELEKDQKKESWWDRAKSAVKKAVKVITSAIDAVFTKIRSAVKTIIEKAKKAAVGLINAARKWVVDKLNKFRDWAKSMVNKYLKDLFPGLAARINSAIDSVVDTAIAGVNAVADAAIATVEALAKALAAALDKILAIYQTALKTAVGIAGAILTGDFAEIPRIAIQGACDIAGIDSKPIFDFIDRAGNLISGILKEPGKFFNNVMNAIGGGVRNFVKNIKKHLIKGLIGWLTGALSEANITMPEKFDFKGILSLALQILGLTRENIKVRIIKKYPPAAKVFSAIEKGVEIVKRIREEGPIALWNMIKEKLSNLKEMVLSGIRDFVITTVIKEAVTWLLSLLNPAGAIVKLLKLAYDFIMFLVERFNQIKDFIMSVYNSIAEIAAGNLGKAIAAVEDAMSRSLPVVISLLARLAGLGGIGKTIKKIIGKITKPINKVIDKIIDKVIKFAKKLFKKGKAVAKKAKEKIKGIIFPKHRFEVDGESHTVSVQKPRGLLISSEKVPAKKFLANFKAQYEEGLPALKEKYLKDAENVIGQIEPFVEEINTLKRDDPKIKEDDPKVKKSLKDILKLEIELSNHIRLLLGKRDESKEYLDAENKYRLEGTVGTFKNMSEQKGDLMTPDHQPRAAVFKFAARELNLFGKDSEMAKREKGHADLGFAILLHHSRHKEGRTYGDKTELAKFEKNVRNDIAPIADEQEQRNIVVKHIKKELESDVDAMRKVYLQDVVWEDIHKLRIEKEEKADLIEDIRGQVKSGESKIALQPINTLKAG
jgi:phage-related protein